MAAMNVSAEQLQNAIRSQNYQPSLGKIGAMPVGQKVSMVYPLQTLGRINDAETFENIIVRTARQGGLLRLKDIAKVEIGQEDYTVTGVFNGQNSILMSLTLFGSQCDSNNEKYSGRIREFSTIFS